MSWGVDLWDQYDKISSHTDHGVEFIKRVATFVEKRINVEHSYAKDLRKLVKGFIRKEEEDSQHTAVKAFSKMIHEVNDLAGQRELISEYLEDQVLSPLKLLGRDTAAERRKHLACGADLHKQLKQTMDTLEKTKKQYERASEDAETALHKLEKADNDPNSTKAKIDQLTVQLRQREEAAEESRNNYILTLEHTNDFRKEHYTTKMPELLNQFQDMNERLINRYKELLGQFAECHRKVAPVINVCLNNITEASNFIDAPKDNQQLITDLKTGFPIPGDVDFEEYAGKQSKKQKKSATKVEAKEDFSHLPPEQRRRRLKQKVESLESLKQKANSDRTAMEKMRKIYEQQPKLGDAAKLQTSLDSNAEKIRQYDSELDKYKGYLAEAQRVLEAAEQQPAAKPKIGAFSKPSTKLSPKAGRKNNKKIDDSDSPVLSPVASSTGHGSGGGDGEWSEGSEDGDDDPPGPQINIPGKVLYDFDGQNEDELSVNASDQVTILEDLNDGWLRVKHKGEEGYVPESYVERLV